MRSLGQAESEGEPGSAALKIGHPSTLSTVGPSTTPMRISPNTAGWWMRDASAPAIFAAAMISVTRSRTCSE